MGALYKGTLPSAREIAAPCSELPMIRPHELPARVAGCGLCVATSALKAWRLSGGLPIVPAHYYGWVGPPGVRSAAKYICNEHASESWFCRLSPALRPAICNSNGLHTRTRSSPTTKTAGLSYHHMQSGPGYAPHLCSFSIRHSIRRFSTFSCLFGAVMVPNNGRPS